MDGGQRLADEDRKAAALRAALGKKRAAQLGTRRTQEYADARLELGYQPATVNRELEVLRRAFQLGVEADPPRLSRAPKVTMLPTDNARAGFLNHSDYERLRDCLEEPIRLAFIIAYHVPARISEVLSLTWSRVDLKQGVVLPPPNQASNKRAGAWPIYGDMKRALNEAAIIAERNWSGLDPVIRRKGKKVIDYRDAWRRGTTAAKLKGLLVHDPRPSAAGNMRLAGVPEVGINEDGRMGDAVGVRALPDRRSQGRPAGGRTSRAVDGEAGTRSARVGELDFGQARFAANGDEPVHSAEEAIEVGFAFEISDGQTGEPLHPGIRKGQSRDAAQAFLQGRPRARVDFWQRVKTNLNAAAPSRRKIRPFIAMRAL